MKPLRSAFGAAVLLGAAVWPACAGVHDPDVELRLSKIVGDWTIAGQEATYRETCVWYGDRAFVVCDSKDESDGAHGVSVLGYSAASGRFTYYRYSGAGATRAESGFPHGTSGITYTDERSVREGIARTQTTLTPEPDGRLHFRLERSVNGGPWETGADFHYVPRR